MKRREFISSLAVAPMAFGCAWAAPALPEAVVFRQSAKQKLKLALGPSERQLISFLRDRARSCYLQGAPVMALLCGSVPQWINVVGSFRSFAELKRELFDFGVTPVSTPELPTSTIKFLYGDLVINLVDAEIDSFCQSIYFSAKERKLAFSHSFLIWDPESGSLHDPYQAVPEGKPNPFGLIGRPASIADSFDWVLAGRFESHFLNLPLSREFEVLEEETLTAEAPPALGRFVAERVLNYLPEIVDTLGMDLARRFARSSLLGSAMREGLQIDFAAVFERFELVRTPNPRFKTSGVEFMSALHQAVGATGDMAMLQGEVCRFMVRNNFTFRRPEWLIPPTAVPNLNLPTSSPSLA